MPIHGIDSDIFFPPRQHADFVIHYEQKALHVHKLILHQHSAYFRTYFETLPPAALPTGRPAKRRKAKRSASPVAAEGKEKCDHPSIAHCIHLPRQTKLVEQKAVTAAEFELFLRHLYFSAHYCYPSYLPKTDIDLDADCAPLSLAFPPITLLNWYTGTTPLRVNAGTFPRKEALLTLAHYLDCQALMAQCEAVLLKQVEVKGRVGDPAWVTSSAWLILPLCHRYHLETAKNACVSVVAAQDGLLQREEFRNAKRWWDKELVMQIMEEALKNRG